MLASICVSPLRPTVNAPTLRVRSGADRAEVVGHRRDHTGMTPAGATLDDHRRVLLGQVDEHATERRGRLGLHAQPMGAGAGGSVVRGARFRDPPFETSAEVGCTQHAGGRRHRTAGLVHRPTVRSV